MDFSLTDEQQLLVETARSLLGHECGPDVVRDVAEGRGDGRRLFDRHLRDWVGLSAGPAVDFALFAVELGAACAPGPFLATAGLFAPCLLAAGHELGEVAAAGEITGTVAVAGADGAWLAADGPTRRQVIDLDLVDHVAFVAAGPTLAIVPSDLVTRRHRVQTLDLLRTFDDVDVPVGVEFARVPSVALDRMALAFAAELVGVARWSIDTAVAYAKERVQFDRPIGSFQAVQHKLVDAALTSERASAALFYAAMCLDAGDPDTARAVHVAKAEAGIAARRCARDSLQVLGGIGFTWEHDLHFRLRRAFSSDAVAGTSSWHHDRLAEALLDT